MRFQLKLDRIELKNFRLFEEVSLTFDDKLTVLIGENGAGKTALLEGVAKALNRVIYRMRNRTSDIDPGVYLVDGDINNERNELDIKLFAFASYHDSSLLDEKAAAEAQIKDIESRYSNDLAYWENMMTHAHNHNEEHSMNQYLGFYMEEQAKMRKEIDEVELPPPNEFEISYSIPFHRSDTQPDSSFTENRVEELNRISDTIYRLYSTKEEVSLPIVTYYSCARLSESKEAVNENVGLYNTYDHALDGLSLDYGRFLEWFVWQDQMSQFRKEENKTLSVVKEAVLTMLNDEGAEKVFTDMYIDPSRFKQPRLMVEKSGTKLEVAQMSSGERSLFVLVGDLARRLCLANPYSDNPLHGQGIVLIDEVDLHLHPRWQRKVLVQLQATFPNIQWVVATHSPTLLTHLEQAKLYRVLDGKVSPLRHFMGMDIRDIYYELYGIEARPPKWKKQIDELYNLIDNEETEAASQKLKELSETLSDDDPVIIEAKTSLELMHL